MRKRKLGMNGCDVICGQNVTSRKEKVRRQAGSRTSSIEQTGTESFIFGFTWYRLRNAVAALPLFRFSLAFDEEEKGGQYDMERDCIYREGTVMG